MMPSQWRLSSRTDQLTIWPMPFILLKRGKFISMAKLANNCSPSVKPPNMASVLAISSSVSTPKVDEIVVLVLHLLILEEHAIFALGHADGVEQMAVGGDVHRLHVGEGGEHHLDLGRLEHAAVFVVVAILHLDIGLGEEAEDLGQQVALVIGELLRPVAAILAQRHFLRHPVDLLLALPDIRTPRDIRTACTACGLRERDMGLRSWKFDGGGEAEDDGANGDGIDEHGVARHAVGPDVGRVARGAN